jgi:hypothetical protein
MTTALITARYNEIRDRIEAFAALAAAAQRGVEVLDLDAADPMCDNVKLAVAEHIWNGLAGSVTVPGQTSTTLVAT